MPRSVALLNLLQAVVYSALAWEMGKRWGPSMAILGVAALGQLLAGGAVALQRGALLIRVGSVLSLLAVALMLGLHLQVALHIIRTFAEGARTGEQMLPAIAAALPWVLFFPVWQLARAGRLPDGGAAGVGALLALAVPAAWGQAEAAPLEDFESAGGAEGAAWLHQRWRGMPVGAAPEGGRTVAVMLVLRHGEVVERADLAGELEEILPRFSISSPYDPAGAVVLEVADAELPAWQPPLSPGVIAAPGVEALRTSDGVLSTLEAWRTTGSREVTPGFSLPFAKAKGLRARLPVKSWMASEAGVVELVQTWSKAPSLGAEQVLEAALAGGLHLRTNMKADGRFTYEIEGPSGKAKGGYNYPRHAGGTWFLARLAQRTGDPRIREAALAAIGHLIAVSKETEDGRGYVLDPSRNDGKAWVGTTALAMLALVELDVEPRWQRLYAMQVASAVDERGAIRGDMDQKTGTWPNQPEITYAQGQGLLALAAAFRAGITEVEPALDRAIAHTDGPYWPMPAANFKTLDEHWICLAAAATQEAKGVAAGKDVCTAYLRDIAGTNPIPGALTNPAAGPAGGLGEAVIARAEIDRRAGVPGEFRQAALDYGELLLTNLYQASDAPLLGRPEVLIGGFRDRPWVLNVRVDAVQHIACALLGVEQLLRDEDLPGAMP